MPSSVVSLEPEHAPAEQCRLDHLAACLLDVLDDPRASGQLEQLTGGGDEALVLASRGEVAGRGDRIPLAGWPSGDGVEVASMLGEEGEGVTLHELAGVALGVVDDVDAEDAEAGVDVALGRATLAAEQVEEDGLAHWVRLS